jgi:peptide/nickel transport system substrate-binding protein
MQSFGSGRRGTRALVVLAAAALVVLALSACGGGSSSGTNGTTSSAPAQQGGTAYLAEGTQAAPNYIFPFASLQFFSTTNFQGFMNLMYRPLYWFGKGATPDLNLSLSLANAPQYSDGGRTIKVTMKPYKWSNGETVTTQDVMFWMNMLKVEKLNWAGYAAGTIPDDLASVTASGNTLTFKLNTAANSNWYTYNELSQITPMPQAWAITKAGQKPQLCGTASYQEVTTQTHTTSKGTTVVPVSAAAKSCAAVYNFLAGEAKKPSTYATNPLWQVVDGPFHLTHFDTTGNVTFVPNAKYSGPVKPKLDKLVELPFTSDEAEFNALAAGKVDVGILPPSDITSNATTTGTCGIKPGANNPRLGANYNLYAGSTWQINYFPLNFNSTGNGSQSGKLFDQLYFRQAFQTLVNQPALIQHISKGYGVPTYGPVPVCPENTFAHSELALGNPYAYSPSKAKGLLTANGWTVNAGGTSVCADAAKCGVAKGTQLSFTLQYVGGSPFEDQLMQAQKSSWAQAGIHVNLTTGTFNTVLSTAIPCRGSGCSWEAGNWGGGWIFSPDYYPSGELLFQTDASSNSGSYSDKRMDTLIKGTTVGNSDLSAYGVFGAKDLPVVWQPITIGATEINKKLQGVTPLNALTNINPENWYFTK